MTWIEYIMLIVLLLTVVPIAIYLSAKLGIYGFLRGKSLYEKDQKNKDKTNYRDEIGL